MKALVFDSSSIISIATNNLLNVLKSLKEKFNGEFYITKSVKKELVDVPLNSKRYKLEAIMIKELIDKGIIKIYIDEQTEKKSLELLDIMNNIFIARNSSIAIMHRAETEALAVACQLGATYVVDERTMRLMIESYKNLAQLLNKKLHTNIKINNGNLRRLAKEICYVNVIRSADLMTVAYELGLLNEYNVDKKQLLDGLLWGLKLRGCSITSNEINEILDIERR